MIDKKLVARLAGPYEIRRVLVTGGAGFIGSALVRHLIGRGYEISNVDKLTYAGNLRSLEPISDSPRYRFYHADIRDFESMADIIDREQPAAIIHLAAETHVDRSIAQPSPFVETNILGTFQMLEAARVYWRSLDHERRSRFRLVHVSTDEVFGGLALDGGIFTEESPYAPSSPYSASKAGADHLARAWQLTYGLPVVLANSSNNYGPFQYPEKLIPLSIINAIEGKPLPVYGTGENVRDWVHVDDHACALELLMRRGRPGESYNVSGRSERTNIVVVETICDILDRLRPRAHGRSRRELISFVPDRPGHDLRYALDSSKIEREFGWKPRESFESGLEKTVEWFLDNEVWWRPIREREGASEIEMANGQLLRPDCREGPPARRIGRFLVSRSAS